MSQKAERIHAILNRATKRRSRINHGITELINQLSELPEEVVNGPELEAIELRIAALVYIKDQADGLCRRLAQAEINEWRDSRPLRPVVAAG